MVRGIGLALIVVLTACGAGGDESTSDTVDPNGPTTSAAVGETATTPSVSTPAAPDPAELDWETIYRDLVAREQEALVANDLDALTQVVTGRQLEYLTDRVELYRYRGYTLDDSGVDRTVDAVELAEVVEDDHVVLHVTEILNGPEVVRAADGSEVHALFDWSEEPRRIQVDVDLVDGEWRTEHHYYMGQAVGIEPLPLGSPAVSVVAEGHTLDFYSWSVGDSLECVGFDGKRPDGTGIGDWTQCKSPADIEPEAGSFTWQALPMAGDDAPLVYFAVGSDSLSQAIELDGQLGTTVDRPNGGTLTVWLQSEFPYAFEVPANDVVWPTGRLGITECGETRTIGPYPDSIEGSFDTIDDIADAVVEGLKDTEWQAGSIEVNQVNRSSFVIWADDVDHETARYVWLWSFDYLPETQRILLDTVEETRTCR